MGMSMSRASPKFVRWAAEDGRANDLIYHLSEGDPSEALKSVSADLKRYSIHLAAARGHARCVQILREAGKTLFMCKLH